MHVLCSFNFVAVEIRDLQIWIYILGLGVRVKMLHQMISGLLRVDDWIRHQDKLSTTTISWPCDDRRLVVFTGQSLNLDLSSANSLLAQQKQPRLPLLPVLDQEAQGVQPACRRCQQSWDRRSWSSDQTILQFGLIPVFFLGARSTLVANESVANTHLWQTPESSLNHWSPCARTQLADFSYKPLSSTRKISAQFWPKKHVRSTVYKRQCWTHSKCFGEILQHIFYSESMTSVLYSLWQADDHQMCWGAWEQSSWASVRQRLSYDVAFTSHDADRPHTHSSRYPHRPPGLHESYTHRTQRPPTLSCSPAGRRYVIPPMATCNNSNALCNIKSDASLTSLPGPPTHTLTLG